MPQPPSLSSISISHSDTVQSIIDKLSALDRSKVTRIYRKQDESLGTHVACIPMITIEFEKLPKKHKK